jgi:flagellar biosynthetic protein FliR
MTGATFSLDGSQVAALFLVFLRTTGFVVAAPLFGNRAIPASVKAGLAAFLAIATVSHAIPATNALPFAVSCVVEPIIGLALGFLLGLGMRATEMIARLLSLQAGLSLSAVYGPTFDEGGTALDPLFAVLSGLLFIAMGLHVALVGELVRSYQTLPLGGPIGPDFASFGYNLIAYVLDLGIQLALPLALALLLVELGVALLSRAIPTINVFVMGLPMTLFAALILILVALPAIISATSHIYQVVFRAVTTGSLP